MKSNTRTYVSYFICTCVSALFSSFLVLSSVWSSRVVLLLVHHLDIRIIGLIVPANSNLVVPSGLGLRPEHILILVSFFCSPFFPFFSFHFLSVSFLFFAPFLPFFLVLLFGCMYVCTYICITTAMFLVLSRCTWCWMVYHSSLYCVVPFPFAYWCTGTAGHVFISFVFFHFL